MNELEIAILKAELLHGLGNCTHSHYSTFEFDDVSYYQYEFERLETMTRKLAASRALANQKDVETVLMDVELQVSIHLAKLLEPTIDPALAGTITSRIDDDEDGNVVICGVCQEEMEKGDEARAIEECMHVFHDSCILEWLKIKSTCPLCRAACKPKKLQFQEIKI